MSKITPELNQPELEALRDLIHRQATTFAALSEARTFREIAATIARHMLEPRHYVSVAVFNHDENGDFIGYRVVATANRRDSWETELEIPIRYDQLGEDVHRLIEEKQAVVIDVVELAKTNPAYEAWLSATPIKGMLALPLIQTDKVIGHIAINALDDMLEMSDAGLELFTGLAHQINIITHANALLSESRLVNTRASDLIHTNRLIATAETIPEMLVPVLRVVPKEVQAIGMLLFDRVLEKDTLPKSISVAGFITRSDGIMLEAIVDKFVPEQAEALQSLLQSLRSENPVIEMDTQAILDTDLVTNHVKALEKYGVEKIVNVGLRAGDLLHGVMVYGIATTFEVDYNLRDNFVILADQIAIVLENRRLLKDATRNVQETQQLYDINRELLSAESGLDVLHTLKNHLAQNAVSLSLIDVTWTADGEQVTSVMLQDLIDQNGAHSPHMELLENQASARIAKYREEWDLQGDDIDFIEDGEALATTRPAVKESLDAGIYASIVIPIREDDRLIQQIFIAFDKKQDFPARTRRVYEAIKDQLTLSVQNRRLLSRLEVSLSETTTLYSAIEALVKAGDSLNILRALRDTIAPDSDALSLVRIQWDRGQDKITSFVMEALINQTTEIQPGREMIDRMDDETRAMYEQQWLAPDMDIEFIESYEALLETRPDLRVGHAQGLRSGILMPIKNDGYVVEFIGIGYKTQQYFSERLRRQYNTLYSQLIIIAQNQLLVRDTRVAAARLGNQVRVLRTLNTLATELPAATDEHAVAEMTCNALLQALSVDHVSVWIEDPLKMMTTVIGEGRETLIGIGRTVPTYRQLREVMLSSEGVYLVEDVENDENIPPALRGYAMANKIHSLAILPLIDNRSGYVGSVQIDMIDPALTITTAELDIARTITNQTAISLQNILLLKSAQEQAKQLQQIASFGQTIQTTFDVEELLHITMISIHEIITCDNLALAIYNTETGYLELSAYSEGTNHVITPRDGEHVELKHTTVGQVWKTHDALQLDDVHTREEMQFIHNPEVHSVIAMPIYLRGTVQGVLEAGSVYIGAYTETDMLVFQQLASQISVSLENAQAYTQNQRLARSKAQVNEITNTLQRQTEIDHIMTVTAREVGKALGAKRARIRLGTPDKQTE